MNIPFYYFNFIDIIITVILSIISCLIGIEGSRFIKKKNSEPKYLLYFSILLGLSFWLTHLFIILTVPIPISTNHYVLYISSSLILYSLGSFLALQMAQLEFQKPVVYILSGVFIGLVIFGADSAGFAIIFKDFIRIKPILLYLSILLTTGTALSILRFLIQLTKEDSFGLTIKWRIAGSILAGFSLGAVPYITLVSIVNSDKLFPSEPTKSYLFLLPFIFIVNSNLFLMLGPEMLGDRILYKSFNRFYSLFKHNPNVIFSLDLHGQILDINKSVNNISGHTREELISTSMGALFETGARREFEQYLDHIKNKDMESLIFEIEMIHKDGTYRNVLLVGAPFFSEKVLQGIYIIVEDITERKRNENLIKHLAYHDELTNLPNKRFFTEKIAELSSQTSFALLFLDFDKFKRINDTFGHSYGNMVLENISVRLEEMKKKCEIFLIARLSGDEFAILVPQKESKNLALHLLTEFSRTTKIGNYEIPFNPSIGISLYPDHSENLEDTIRYADLAMYQAKRDNSGYKFFDKEMSNNLVEAFTLENDLRNAIHNQELLVYFQPKFNTIANTCIGAEALLRWKHPEKGFISPMVFIPMAEETGLITQIEKFVITQVMEALHKWNFKGHDMKRVSINISQVTLKQPDFLHVLELLLESYQIDGKWLEFEITERLIMENEKNINNVLMRLKQLGIEISIDDFGTGYSSLSYLQYLSIDRLKIDKSFIDQSLDNSAILSAIIGMATRLNIKFIAEGVEKQHQIDLLKELGCFEVQGYYYSPAVTEEIYENYL